MSWCAARRRFGAMTCTASSFHIEEQAKRAAMPTTADLRNEVDPEGLRLCVAFCVAGPRNHERRGFADAAAASPPFVYPDFTQESVPRCRN